MDVVVYRTAVHPDAPRAPARPVAPGGAAPSGVPGARSSRRAQSADENAMIAAGRSMTDREQLRLRGPAVAAGRHDQRRRVRPDRHQPQRSRVPSACGPTRASTCPRSCRRCRSANGLVYTYTHRLEPATGTGPRSTTAPGKTVYKVYAGTGVGYNNNYAGISISPPAPSTSGRSAGSSRCATGELGAVACVIGGWVVTSSP